jgi:hypothetical protein
MVVTRNTALPADFKVVWRSTVTVLVLNKHRSKALPAAAALGTAGAAAQASLQREVIVKRKEQGPGSAVLPHQQRLPLNIPHTHSNFPCSCSLSQAAVADREVEAWRLDGSVGRRYGLINGDLNPIHL